MATLKSIVVATTPPPVDLEIRITTPWGDAGQSLEYELSSPSGVVGFHHARIRGPSIQRPEEFQRNLFHQLEKLHDNLDVDGNRLMGDEIFDDLTTIGLDLYRRLFSQDMQRAYLKFRDKVVRLLVTSDEPWIPWEILRPLHDDSDDFFCTKFQMSRWLAGETPMPQGKHIANLACFEVGRPEDLSSLPHAADERRLLESLAKEAGLVPKVLEEPRFSDVEGVLRQKDLGLVHFVGHGDRDEARPDEAKIVLADRPFRVRHLGMLQEKLRKNRPVVFFNACRLAQLGQTLTGIGGWAERWVKDCGASAFVAPFCSVDDGRAFRFAELFYENLKQGKELGEAVFEARHRLREEDPNEMAWLAYSLYGHPSTHVTFGARGPAVVEAAYGGQAVPASGRRVTSAVTSQGTRRTRQRTSRAAQRRKSSRRRVLVALATLTSTILVALVVAFSGRWGITSPPATSGPGLVEPRATEIDSSVTSPPVAPPPQPPTTAKSVDAERYVEQPRQEVPLLPIVPGRIGIIALDRETQQPDRDVASAIESVFAELEDFDPVILRMEIADVEDLLSGSSPILSDDGLSRHGVEYLLVATTSLEEKPQTTSILHNAILSMKTQLLTADSSFEKLRSSATHTGLGRSSEEALIQAAERCLREITDSLMEGGKS